MPASPAVLFTFDDGYTNNYTLAYPTLAAYNINATIFMITDWIDGFGLTTAQLTALDAAGWDIGNHTASHPHLDTLPEADQETELSTAKAVLDGLGLTRASAHVAYPFGDYNADTLTAMANTGMLTGRLYETINKNGFDMSTIDWYEIVSFEVTNTTSLETVKGVIQLAMCQGLIIDLVFHNIISTGPPAANEWLASDLAALADWINEQYLPTLTISQLHSLRSGNLVYDNPWYS